MEPCKIKNVIFDIGNVMVRWSPNEIIRLSLGDVDQPEKLAAAVFQSELWLALNKGELSELQAKDKFEEQFGFSAAQVERIFYYIKQTQIPLFGTVDLLTRVKAAGYGVYALTDNVREIVDYLQTHYSFWSLFDGAIVSAEVGCLKPHPEIFHCLLNEYTIQASESVFIDDMPHNVEGAKSVGFFAIQCENAEQCERDLKSLGLSF